MAQLLIGSVYMSRTLKVQLAVESPDLVHEFRNFGEDVYRAFRDEYEVSIGEIDASTTDFHVRGIPKREVRTVAAGVRKLAEKYFRLTVEVSETKPNQNG